MNTPLSPMSTTVVHPWFGALDSRVGQDADVCWEQTLNVNGAPVQVQLWVAHGTRFDPARLDAFAALLHDADRLDAHARQHLRDDATQLPGYIEFHVTQQRHSPVLAALTENGAHPTVAPAAFVQAMRLHAIALWYGSEASPYQMPFIIDGEPRLEPSAPMVMDYMIDPAHSDEILAVKLSLDGVVTDIAWES